MTTGLTSRALSPDEVAHYRENGFLILRGVFPPDEAEALRAAASRLWESDLVTAGNLRCTFGERPGTGERYLRKLHPVIDVSPELRSVSEDPRILGPARELLEGEPALLVDRLIGKEAGSAGYGQHQDYAYWQWYPLPILTAMVSLDVANAENGAISVYPGHHRRGLITPPREMRYLCGDELCPADDAVLVETQPGDVLFFDSLTPHSSEASRGSGSRRYFYLSYNRAEAGNFYQEYAQRFRRYLAVLDEKGAREQKFFR